MTLRDITPAAMQCGVGACPAIFQTETGAFVIVGKRVPISDHAELVGRVGDGETVIEIPCDLIAGLSKQ